MDLAHGLLCKDPNIQRLKTNNPMVFGHCGINPLMITQVSVQLY